MNKRRCAIENKNLTVQDLQNLEKLCNGCDFERECKEIFEQLSSESVQEEIEKEYFGLMKYLSAKAYHGSDNKIY